MSRHLAPPSLRLDLRFVPAGLGLVWLPLLALLAVAWLAGIAVCVWLAHTASGAVMAGDPLLGQANVRLGPALMGALMMSLFPAFLTAVAGLLGAQMLAMACAEDRIMVTEHALTVLRRLGTFRHTETFERERIRAVFATPPTHRLPPRLYAVVDEQLAELSLLASPTECPRAALQLRQALAFPEEHSATPLPALPAPWRTRRATTGEPEFDTKSRFRAISSPRRQCNQQVSAAAPVFL